MGQPIVHMFANLFTLFSDFSYGFSKLVIFFLLFKEMQFFLPLTLLGCCMCWFALCLKYLVVDVYSGSRDSRSQEGKTHSLVKFSGSASHSTTKRSLQIGYFQANFWVILKAIFRNLVPFFQGFCFTVIVAL